MNASNHLRCAVSSMTREAKGIVWAIAAKGKFQFLLRVLVGCSGQVQRGRHTGSARALISPFALCSLSRDGKLINT